MEKKEGRKSRGTIPLSRAGSGNNMGSGSKVIVKISKSPYASFFAVPGTFIIFFDFNDSISFKTSSSLGIGISGDKKGKVRFKNACF